MKVEKLRFFKTMPDYKELIILSEIDEDPHVTQKEIASKCGITPPMVNKYLFDLEKQGYVEIRGTTTRNTTYHLTGDGKNRLMILNISYSREVLKMYKDSQKNFEQVWNYLLSNNLKRVVLFGAGDVGEMAFEIMKDHDIKIVGLIDEDEKRIGKEIEGLKISPLSELNQMDFDAVVITSYRHGAEMAKRVITDKPVFIFSLENGVTSLKLARSK